MAVRSLVSVFDRTLVSHETVENRAVILPRPDHPMNRTRPLPSSDSGVVLPWERK